VLNVHHYDELNDAPRGQQPRFLGLWRQIAARYASRPTRLYFELLNEPRAAMTATAWNELIPLALAAIRERDPGRAVIVGPARMNDIGALPELELPDDDRLVVGVHYYAPFEPPRDALLGDGNPLTGCARAAVRDGPGRSGRGRGESTA
jgi:endoglucanase